MQSEKFWTLLLYAFLAVACINALLASCTRQYFKNRSSGLLSHSQLRIKQGTADFEHRLNVFVQTFLLSLISWRIYMIVLPVWLASCAVYMLPAFMTK